MNYRMHLKQEKNYIEMNQIVRMHISENINVHHEVHYALNEVIPLFPYTENKQKKKTYTN